MFELIIQSDRQRVTVMILEERQKRFQFIERF